MFHLNPLKIRTSKPEAVLSSLSDAVLVQQAAGGEKRAFIEIVARHQKMVCAVALGVLGDFAASEDAAQETFVAAWEKLSELRDPERLRPWLAQIARNTALAQLRRRKPHSNLDEFSTIPDVAPTPDELVATEEEMGVVRASLNRLPEQYREPLVLFYSEGQSVREVAAALELSEDAVKQRLARGREMLRGQLSSLLETVLTRRKPSAALLVAVAAGIGALAAPATVAGFAFAGAASAGGGGLAGLGGNSSLLAAMNASKAGLFTAAVITAAAVPLGFYATSTPLSKSAKSAEHETKVEEAGKPSAPTYEQSVLFAEWRQLHETYGSTPQSMPVLYKVISEMKDDFRRRAFRAALISEWSLVDPVGGLAYFLQQEKSASNASQLFAEWITRDPGAAVNALLSNNDDRIWESLARDHLAEIARKSPSQFPQLVKRLPDKEQNNDQLTSAFSSFAEHSLEQAKKLATDLLGRQRDLALGGVAQSIAKTDLNAAVEWAQSLPKGIDQDEVIRSALIGRAKIDPVSALEYVDSIPPGGRPGWFADTTGGKVLREAAKVDLDATLNWIAENPNRLGHADLNGLVDGIEGRLNEDPVRSLEQWRQEGKLASILPSISNALLNDAQGQIGPIWEWLKKQPEDATTQSLREFLQNAAAWNDPKTAMKLAEDSPRTEEGQKQLKRLAESLINGGTRNDQLDHLLRDAPEQLRGPLVEAAFSQLRSDNVKDPAAWVSRLEMLPADARQRGYEQVAKSWGTQSPEEAINWAQKIPDEQSRATALAGAAEGWARTDPGGAFQWAQSLGEGREREPIVQRVAENIARYAPEQAWELALSLQSPAQKEQALGNVANRVAEISKTEARRLIENSRISSEQKQELLSRLQKRGLIPTGSTAE